jgi:hypothetical protein
MVIFTSVVPTGPSIRRAFFCALKTFLYVFGEKIPTLNFKRHSIVGNVKTLILYFAFDGTIKVDRIGVINMGKVNFGFQIPEHLNGFFYWRVRDIAISWQFILREKGAINDSNIHTQNVINQSVSPLINIRYVENSAF